MAEWNDGIPDATVAERLAAKVLLRKAGTTDPAECNASDFLQQDAIGEITTTGNLRAGSGDAPSGGIWGAMRYLPGQMPHVFGGMYSSGKILIGYGVRSSTTAADTFLSSIDNASWARGALVVGNDLKYYSAGAQATAVGSVVSMSLQFTIDGSGNAGFGTAAPAYKIHAFGGPSTSILSESNTTYGGQFRAKNTVREYAFGMTGAVSGDWHIYDVSNAQLVHSYLNTSGHVFYTSGATRLSIGISGQILPGADGAQNVGGPALRWGTFYAATGTINTSDERAKRDIGAIPDEWLDAWGAVEWCRYKFTDGNRWHVGLIAQRVHEAFEARGLDAFEIGLCCYDEWPEERRPIYRTEKRTRVIESVEYVPAGEGEDGQQLFTIHVVETTEQYEEPVDTGETELVRAAGNRWGLRYDECQAMEAAWQRRELERVLGRLMSLEAR